MQSSRLYPACRSPAPFAPPSKLATVQLRLGVTAQILGVAMRIVAISALVPIACVGIVAMPALANAQNKLTAMVILQGTCKKLVGGKARTSDCTGKLLNTEYSDGRLGFYFVTTGGMALTFSTRGREQVKADENTAIVPVDMLFTTGKGQTDKVQAVGTCKFANPYRGVPAPVECTADTARGRYEAAFLSDGSKPDNKTFD